MKPSLQFSVPCLEIPDEPAKPPSFHYLFFELPFPQFPFMVEFFVANGWANGEGSFRQSLRILKPDHETLFVQTGDQPFQLKTRTEPYMVVNKFEKVVFEEPGVYWFQVSLDGAMVVEYPVTVRQADAGRVARPTAAAESAPAPKAPPAPPPAKPDPAPTSTGLQQDEGMLFPGGDPMRRK